MSVVLFTERLTGCELVQQTTSLLQENSFNLLHHSEYVPPPHIRVGQMDNYLLTKHFSTVVGLSLNSAFTTHSLYIYISPALQAFRDQYHRDPSCPSDSELLLSLRETVALKYGISKDLFEESFVRSVKLLR